MAPKRKAPGDCPVPRRSPRAPPTKPYVYETLLNDEIRILILAPGHDEDLLRARLETVSIQDHPKYKAISYAWGDPVFPHPLQLPQGQIYITESLFGALRRFRSETEPVRLWADAVCIDQEGIQEKNHQVANMHQIYERAEEVLVWLGPPLPSDCLVFHIINEFRYGPEFDFKSWKESIEECERIQMDFLERVKNTVRKTICTQCACTFKLSLRNTADALAEFYQRLWFSRLWVYQEAWVATTYTMYFGQHRISSVALRQFWYNFSFGQSQIAKAQEDWRDIMEVLISDAAKYDERPDLLTMMFRTRKTSCSNPLDRVFAIRRIAKVHETSDLVPDYSIAAEDLWERTAIVELLNPHRWNHVSQNPLVLSPVLVLAVAGLQQRFANPGTRSWVPDFNDLTDECERKYSYHIWNSRNHCAGGRSHMHATVQQELGLLWIRGRFFTCISEICSESQLNPEFGVGVETKPRTKYIARIRRDLFPWYAKCLAFYSSYATAYQRQEDSTKLLLQHGDVADAKPCPHYHVVLQTFEKWKATNHSFPCEIDAITMFRDLAAYFCPKDVLSIVLDRTRVLASTTSSSVGWVPEATRPGDLVTLFEGSPFPVILRNREDGYYSVIGDAYIQGIMHGEEWPNDEQGVDWIGMR